MKRKALGGAAAVVAVAVVAAVASRATEPAPPISQQTVAQKLLATQRTRFMSATALRVLRQIAGRSDPERGGEGAAEPVAAGPAGRLAVAASLLPNVRVNDPAMDSHQIDQTTQSETTIAVAGSNVAVGYNDTQHGLLTLTAATNTSGVAWSGDGGRTFTDLGNIPNAVGLANLGDPWLAADRQGRMFYGTLVLDAANGPLGVGVARSTSGGRHWAPPVEVSPKVGLNSFYLGDKDAVAAGADAASPGRDAVYATWDDVSCLATTFTCTDGLALAKSTDGGVSYTLSYVDQNSEQDCSFTGYFGTQPLVTTGGVLFVAAERISVDDPQCEGTGQLALQEVVFRSADGGRTFSPARAVETITPATPSGFVRLGRGQLMRLNEAPSIAFHDGRLYVAWNDGRLGAPHIRFATSANGGQTWSRSWATDGGSTEVMPALSADAAGVHLLFYNIHGNAFDAVLGDSAGGTNFAFRRVSSESSRGVVTAPNFDPTVAWGYMGDYVANVSAGGHRYLAWGDNRDRVTNWLWPQGRPDPDVFFARD